MWPTAMFANYRHARIITQFTWFDIPLIVIFKCAAHEPVHNNGCEPLQPPLPLYTPHKMVFIL